MRKLFIVLGVLVLAGFTYGQGITGSAHDFSGSGWNGTGEICITCHTPHNAVAGQTALWNHEVTGATFNLYDSPTLDATDIDQPSGSSKLCLSCHDGTVALDNFGGTTGGTNFISTGLVGIDLSDDHPISFTYDATLVAADGGLVEPTTANSSGLGGTITEDLLRNNQVQCSSCHDVHNKYNLAYLLVKSNAASALCLTCHVK